LITFTNLGALGNSTLYASTTPSYKVIEVMSTVNGVIFDPI